jgi:hypothetical protein
MVVTELRKLMLATGIEKVKQYVVADLLQRADCFRCGTVYDATPRNFFMDAANR